MSLAPAAASATAGSAAGPQSGAAPPPLALLPTCCTVRAAPAAFRGKAAVVPRVRGRNEHAPRSEVSQQNRRGEWRPVTCVAADWTTTQGADHAIPLRQCTRVVLAHTRSRSCQSCPACHGASRPHVCRSPHTARRAALTRRCVPSLPCTSRSNQPIFAKLRDCPSNGPQPLPPESAREPPSLPRARTTAPWVCAPLAAPWRAQSRSW